MCFCFFVLFFAASVLATKNASVLAGDGNSINSTNEDSYGDSGYAEESPDRFNAWGVLGRRFVNESFPSGSNVSCYGVKYFSHEGSLGYPFGDMCVLVSHHLSDFDGGCAGDSIFSPADAPNRTKIGTLGAMDLENDLRLLVLDPPHSIPFYFASEHSCIVQSAPLRVRKHGASTGATDARVEYAFKAINVEYYSAARKYSPPLTWLVKAHNFATPDDSGALVEGLVKDESGTLRWCDMGMILGGGPDEKMILILPMKCARL